MREELKQMDQRRRKLMMMDKALHPRDDFMWQEKKEDSPALSMAFMQQYNDSNVA